MTALSPRQFLATLESTHMHVIGSTGRGKSKFLELLLQEALTSRRGFCLIDWHGTLYQEFLGFLSYLRPKNVDVILLNASQPEFVTGYNPFVSPAVDRETLSAFVARRMDATVRPWGATNTDETPQLARVLRHLFTFAAETGETLPNAQLLLYAEHEEIRKYAARVLSDPYTKDFWSDCASMSGREFRQFVASTQNRLDRFLSPLAIRRIMGLPTGNINIAELMEKNTILLVNLAGSKYLTSESGRLLAALLLNEFLEAALQRAGTKKRYVLCLDEFQEYMTADVAAMLDQVRKGGLNLILSHQRLGQLMRDEELDDAVATEAQLKVVFGGLDFDTASDMAKNVALGKITQRQIKETYFHTLTKHQLDYALTETYSESKSKGRGSSSSSSHFEWNDGESVGRRSNVLSGSSSNESETVGSSETISPMLMPYYEKEKTHDAEWSHEEKIAREALRIMDQPQRNCLVKMPQSSSAYPYVVPFIDSYVSNPEKIRSYERSLYEKQRAAPAAEVDRQMRELRDAFLAKTRKKKKPDGGGSSRPTV